MEEPHTEDSQMPTMWDHWATASPKMLCHPHATEVYACKEVSPGLAVLCPQEELDSFESLAVLAVRDPRDPHSCHE